VFVALAIQHAMRMRRFVLPSVVWLALPYFPTLSHKWRDFRKKDNMELKTYVLIFSKILSETFLILRRIQWDTIVNAHRSSCKVPVILARL